MRLNCIFFAELSQNGSSDAGSTSKKARYEEPDGRVHTDLSYAEQGLSQQYDTSFPMQSQASNALGDWETPQSSLGHFETSTDRGGKMVVRKKRFKHVASKKVVPIVPSVPNIHIQREERSDVTVSVGVKPEGLDTDDNVNDRTVNETDAVNYIPRVTDSEQSLSQPSVKVEQDDGDDDDDMAITGVEPGNSQSGYQSSEMDGSFDQSYQQGDSFISPNASAGDLSYAKAG